MIKRAIEERRISPFLKCYKGRDIITGAVLGTLLGRSKEILEYLLSFKYILEFDNNFSTEADRKLSIIERIM